MKECIRLSNKLIPYEVFVKDLIAQIREALRVHNIIISQNQTFKLFGAGNIHKGVRLKYFYLFILKFIIMQMIKLVLDDLTKEFIFEVFDRIENNHPDDSLEYGESVVMTTYELAEQLVEGEIGLNKNMTIISIGKYEQDFLKEIYEISLEDDEELFQLDLLTEMEQFLYELGKRLLTKE